MHCLDLRGRATSLGRRLAPKSGGAVALWLCAENNPHVQVGNETYYLNADGLLMPAKKDQAPPDLRYFGPTRNETHPDHQTVARLPKKASQRADGPMVHTWIDPDTGLLCKDLKGSDGRTFGDCCSNDRGCSPGHALNAVDDQRAARQLDLTGRRRTCDGRAAGATPFKT
jgi:hypothetical protein